MLLLKPDLGSRVLIYERDSHRHFCHRPAARSQSSRRRFGNCAAAVGAIFELVGSLRGLASAVGTMLLTALSRQRQLERRLSRLIFRPSFQALAVGDRALISLSIMSGYASVSMAAGTFKWRRIMLSG